MTTFQIGQIIGVTIGIALIAMTIFAMYRIMRYFYNKGLPRFPHTPLVEEEEEEAPEPIPYLVQVPEEAEISPEPEFATLVAPAPRPKSTRKPRKKPVTA